MLYCEDEEVFFFYLTIAIKCPIQFFALLNDKYLYGLTGNPQIHQ